MPPPQIHATPGARVVLPCPIQPGALLQHYSVQWLKDNLLSVEYNPQLYMVVDPRYQINRSTFSLIIDPVNVNDSSMNYQCRVFVTNPLNGVMSVLQPYPQRDVLSLSVSKGILVHVCSAMTIIFVSDSEHSSMHAEIIRVS